MIRLPAQDVALLDRLAHQHGSITAAILAALRSLDQPPPAPTPVPPGPVASAQSDAPSEPSEDAASALPPPPRRRPAAPQPRRAEWWVSLYELADRMQVRPEAVRRRAKAQGALRGRGASAEVNIDKLVVDRYLAARIVGVTSATLRRHVRLGKVASSPDALEICVGDVYRERAS